MRTSTRPRSPRTAVPEGITLEYLQAVELADIPLDRSFAGWSGPDPRRPTLTSLERRFPIEVARTAYTWATSGWQCIVRSNPRESAVIVTLHGMVVEHATVPSRSRALRIADQAFEFAVGSVSACLGDMLDHLGGIHPALWTSEEVHDLVEPRWLYQALTGLHVDFVNTLIMLGARTDVFGSLALDPTHPMAAPLVGDFPGIEHIAQDRPILSLLWANTPRTERAAPEEAERLLGGSYVTEADIRVNGRS